MLIGQLYAPDCLLRDHFNIIFPVYAWVFHGISSPQVSRTEVFHVRVDALSVLLAVTMKSTVLYDVTPCSLAEICRVHLYQTTQHSYSSLEMVNLCHIARRHSPENLQNSVCIAICHPLWSDRTNGVQPRMHIRLSLHVKSIYSLR